MNPARTTRSTACFRRALTTSRSNASRSFPNSLWSITIAGIRCLSARPITGAPGTLQTRTARFTSRSPRSRASTRLWKSVPLPDARMPTLNRAIRISLVLEQPQPGEHHRDAVIVRGPNHLGVPDRPARLRDRGDAPLRELVEPVAEAEVRVAHRDAPLRGVPRLVAREHARVHAAHLARPDPHGPLAVDEDDRVRLHEAAHPDPERDVPQLVRRGAGLRDYLPRLGLQRGEVRRLQEDAPEDADHVDAVVPAELPAGPHDEEGPLLLLLQDPQRVGLVVGGDDR